MNTETTTTASATISSIEEASERRWLLDYKDRTGLSWSELAQQSGVPSGTA